MSAPDRRAKLDRDHAERSIRRQCAMLGVARSGVYRKPRPASDNDLEAMRRGNDVSERVETGSGLCRAVRAQLVGHPHIGCEAFFLEQLAHQFSRLQPYRAVVARAGQEPHLRRRPRARARTASPRLSRRSHRDATATMAADVCREVRRTSARTSKPTVAPSRRPRYHVRPADLRRRVYLFSPISGLLSPSEDDDSHVNHVQFVADAEPAHSRESVRQVGRPLSVAQIRIA
jgi:hypothetical protein